MTDKPISDYLMKPIRDLCKCKRGPVNPEYEVCEQCYLDAQADIVDLDERRDFRKWGG